jgi:hypothetical protein
MGAATLGGSRREAEDGVRRGKWAAPHGYGRKATPAACGEQRRESGRERG